MGEFYLDHDVAVRVAEHLSSLGHNAVTARDLHREKATDPEHLLEATNLRRYFVTHNARDFNLLHDAWVVWRAAWSVDTQPHATILILAQQPQRPGGVTLSELHAERLRDFIESIAAPSLSGQIYRYREGHGWGLEPRRATPLAGADEPP